VEVAKGASHDAGGVPVALLGDYLPLLTDAAVSGRRPKRVELDAVGRLSGRPRNRASPPAGWCSCTSRRAQRLWQDLPVVVRSRDSEVMRAAAVLHVIDDAVATLAEGYAVARRDLVRQESLRRERKTAARSCSAVSSSSAVAGTGRQATTTSRLARAGDSGEVAGSTSAHSRRVGDASTSHESAGVGQAVANGRDAERGPARRPDPGVTATEIDAYGRGFHRDRVDVQECTRDPSSGGGTGCRGADRVARSRLLNRGGHWNTPSGLADCWLEGFCRLARPVTAVQTVAARTVITTTR
jgi:hypothetical protein